MKDLSSISGYENRKQERTLRRSSARGLAGGLAIIGEIQKEGENK
jgi:hypothetical protein